MQARRLRSQGIPRQDPEMCDSRSDDAPRDRELLAQNLLAKLLGEADSHSGIFPNTIDSRDLI
ncbi:hypothetical protein GCM10007874_59150 [Labrys miyagiensis]|uniref:Uncharacterized protein n=1 Tax=Labrys miyagiensis TaxID=346912 RepID=A0ABQ6CRZ5_9HYPH|nr:hypothetical protein GCM10007874_59150 [Labrys miyagiensis]